MILDECESTNDVAKKLAESGAPHGAWVSARRQGSGRGRLGRKWESIEGNLFLSIIARARPGLSIASASWSLIPIAAAVGIAECLERFNPRLDVAIKWPNDLWLGGAKLGGILCEATAGASNSYVVIGVGLNCVRVPRDLDQPAASLTEFLSRTESPSGPGGAISADEIRLPIVASILDALQDLESDAGAIIARFERRAVLKVGASVEWSSGAGTHLGVVRGLGSGGELLVEEGGVARKLYAEDVKLRL